MKYIVERRVANTKQWNVIATAPDRATAMQECSVGDRPLYAGVRITPVTGDDAIDAYASHELVNGTLEP